MKKNLKTIILSLILLFMFCCETKGLTYGGCEYDKISRLKSFVSNVNLSYHYYEMNNNVYFSVTITNLIPEIYFIDSATGIRYDYSNTVDGELIITGYKNFSGIYKFYSSIGQCYGIKLGNKYYNFPSYNVHYETPICKENPNFSLCQKWTKVTQSYNELEKLINKYNETKDTIQDEEIVTPEYRQTYIDFLVKIYINYYYYILIGIIAVCVTIMVISKKKNSFDL